MYKDVIGGNQFEVNSEGFSVSIPEVQGMVLIP
jgi:hypothetical protein